MLMRLVKTVDAELESDKIIQKIIQVQTFSYKEEEKQNKTEFFSFH